MKLLIYSLNTSPELLGVGKYTGDMAEYFAEPGAVVTLRGGLGTPGRRGSV